MQSIFLFHGSPVFEGKWEIDRTTNIIDARIPISETDGEPNEYESNFDCSKLKANDH